jgi:hypothetical protein
MVFPLLTQPIFFGYLTAIAGALYLSSKPQNEAMNLFLAFTSRWTLFIVFTVISFAYIPENTLIAMFLLVYLNATFNPPIKPVIL